MDSPFIPGAKVAVDLDGGYRAPHGYTEQFVEKTYKNGRFTLRGSSQQWRPHEPSHYQNYWSASQTGEHGWTRTARLRIWDTDGNAEIIAAQNNFRRYGLFTKIQREIEHLRYDEDRVTDEILDLMKRVVLAMKPVKDAVNT